MNLLPLFEELNRLHFQGELPPPLFVWNSRLRSAAGRFAPGSKFPPIRPARIELAEYLLKIENSSHHIRDTLLHEMVHYYLWNRRQPWGHTAEFKEILKRVGASRYNTVPQKGPPRFRYQCPQCREIYGTKRKIRPSACLPCCRKFSRGRFDRRFSLVLLEQNQGEAGKTQIQAEKSLKQSQQPPVETEPPPFFSVEDTIRKLEALKQMLRR